MKIPGLIRFIVVLCAGLLLAESVLAEKVKVGMSGALTGPLSEMGLSMHAGINAFFSQMNAHGGIQGNTFELVTLDDAYEPVSAAANMRQLITEQEVVAILGNIGTPTAVVTVPIAEHYQIAFVGAFSGGDVLRRVPPSPYVFNFRPGYQQEVDKLINGLLNAGLQPEDLAFFTQQDSYGNAVFQAAVSALQTNGFEKPNLLPHVQYTRNTLNVEKAVATILKAKNSPKVILMGGTYAPAAKFIKLLHKDNPNTWFVNVSFVGSHMLETSLKGTDANVIVSQVVPEIDADLPIVKEYRQALEDYDKTLQPNTVSLEGYIVAKVFCLALKRIDGPINRTTVLNALNHLDDVDIGLGRPINLASSASQANKKVWLSTLKNGVFQSFEWRNFDLSQ